MNTFVDTLQTATLIVMVLVLTMQSKTIHRQRDAIDAHIRGAQHPVENGDSQGR